MCGRGPRAGELAVNVFVCGCVPVLLVLSVT
jgi:hypothetical protein